MPTPVEIAPARGKLGVLLVGLGAVSTTTIAGVLAIRKGFAKPIGSLTQMGTIRLGKRTEGRSPKISDVVPLSALDDLVFGGWDIFEDDCYAAARTAGVLEPALLEQVRPELETDPAVAGGVRSALREAARRPERQEGQEQEGSRRAGRRRHPQVQGRQRARSPGDGLVRQHRGLHDRVAGASDRSRASSGRSKQNDPAIPSSMVYAYAADPRRHSVRERRAQPDRRHSGAGRRSRATTKAPLAGKDLKTGQTLIKTIIAPGLKARLLGVEGWYSTNILGNRDGEVLDDPESFKTKEESKKSVLDYILQPQLYPDLYEDLCHVVRINYYPPRGDNKEGWDNIDLVGWLGYPMQLKINFLCRDSILAAPIVLDVALFLDLAKRAGMHGIQEWLSFYFKSPVHAPGLYPEHDLFIQLMKLKNTLRYLKGEELITHLGREYYD